MEGIMDKWIKKQERPTLDEFFMSVDTLHEIISLSGYHRDEVDREEVDFLTPKHMDPMDLDEDEDY